jgi:fermentation-respiration switch protein FrsA (DUF1100 family)
MLARGLATLDAVVPMNEVDKVTCPVLLIAVKQDDMIPHAYVEEAYARLRAKSEMASYDCGHFDLYVGPPHAENARRQVGFLTDALRAP